MRKSKYTDEQIIGFIQEVEAGTTKVSDLARRIGVTPTTFFRWRAKFEGMDVAQAKRLRALEDENRRLKQIVADQTLDIQAQQEGGEVTGEVRSTQDSTGDLFVLTVECASTEPDGFVLLGGRVTSPEDAPGFGSLNAYVLRGR